MHREPIPALQAWRRHAQAMAWARALQRLPDHRRAALLLHDAYGFAIAEVAEILDTTPAAVEAILVAARAALEAPFTG